MKNITINTTMHEERMNLVVETDNYKKCIIITPIDVIIHRMDKEPKAELIARRAIIEEEFITKMNDLASNNSLDLIAELIPTRIKKDFLRKLKRDDQCEADL